MQGTIPVAQMVKNLPAGQETWLDPWVGKILWRREWPATPVFQPGESHGQRSLVGYSPWGLKESDTTQRLTVQSNTWFRTLGIPRRNRDKKPNKNHTNLMDLTFRSRETDVRCIKIMNEVQA